MTRDDSPRRPPATAQRAVMAVGRGLGRHILALLYALAARAVATYARWGEQGATAYLRGTMASGEAVHGVTDIDLVIVVAPDPSGVARARVRGRFRAAARALDRLGGLIDHWPLVHDQPGLAEVTSRSALSYGLDHGDGAYWGPSSDVDKIRMLERPGLYGPGRSWRLLAGPDRRPIDGVEDLPARRIVCWLELQNWWRWAFQACLEPDRPGSAYICVKLISEAARIWLWLTRGEHIPVRLAALARGRTELPGEAAAFDRARRLHGALRAARSAPLTEFLPPFLRLSELIAGELARQVATAGVTEVALLTTGGSELAPPAAGVPSATVANDAAKLPCAPLLDWRALVIPPKPDETFAIVAGDPGDPTVLSTVATAGRRGPYLTLRADQLLLRPLPSGGRGRLRTVQCELTDPVSFALARADRTARFSNARGWSIQDTASRAVAEHRAWLDAGAEQHDGTALGMLITAARAALLWETVADGEPQLPLNVDATTELLAARVPSVASVMEGAREAYHDFAHTRADPPTSLVSDLRALVRRLPGYADRQATLKAA